MTGELSAAIQSKLTASLFKQPVILVIGGIVPMGVALISYSRTGSRWFLLAFAVYFTVLAARLWINVDICRKPDKRTDRLCRKHFLIGSCVGALTNGVAAAIALHLPDSFVQMIVLTSFVAIVAGSAARNAVYPLAAYSYILLAGVFPVLSCLTPAERAYLPFLLAFIISAYALARHQYRQIVNSLLGEEQNAVLVEVARDANLQLAQANAQLEILASEKDLALIEQQRYFRTVVANAPVILIALDGNGTIVVAEGRDLDRLGHAGRTMIGKSFRELSADVPELVAQAERALSGESHAADLTVGGIVLETRWKPHFNESGAIASVIAVATDITDRRVAELALHHRSLHDALTGLPNRTALNERLADLFGPDGTAARTDDLALAFMNLDRFHEINDTLGLDVGDALLHSVAQRIDRRLFACNVVGGAIRLGGDEFALLLPAHDERHATAIIRTVLTDFDEPHVVGDYRVNLSASVGLALFPAHAPGAKALQRCAEVAMHSAKATGVRFVVFDEAQDRHSAALRELEADMREAIITGGFQLVYQPQVNMRNGRIESVEALLRWEHPVRGRIMPDEFIPLAEKTGLIVALTHWVIDEAVRQISAWRAGGIHLSVAVNISMRGLREAALPQTVAHVLGKYGVTVDQLVLEVTESVIVADDGYTLAIFAQLAEMGVVLSIDDFGTGYSSLAYLRQLPVAELKIDKSFVLALDAADAKARELVRLIIDLAHHLGLRVVAEGVESEEVFDFLAGLGCDIGQGFFMSRPVTADDVSRLLSATPFIEPECAGVLEIKSA